MQNSLVDFLIGCTATWRLSSLFLAGEHEEEGPFSFLSRIRDAVGVRYDERSRPYGVNELAKIFICIYCLSIWCGAIIALLQGGGIRRLFLRALAYSAGAIWFKRLG